MEPSQLNPRVLEPSYSDDQPPLEAGGPDDQV